MAGGALWAIAMTALPLAPKLLLAAAVCVHLLILIHRQNTLRGLLLLRDGEWLWVDGGGECPLQLRAATAWPGLIVLRMREPAGRGRVFTLLADSSDRDAQRRLRVCLRYLPVFGATSRES